MTAITFRVVPAFLLQAREEPMTWSKVISELDELTAENEHFEFYWFPHSEGCLTKRNNRTDGPASPLPRWRYLLDDEFLSNTLFGLTCKLGRRVPPAIPAVNSVAARALGTRTYTDAAYKVFTSPRRVRFKEQEYAVPRAALSDVLGEVRSLIPAARLAHQLPDRGPRDAAGRPLAVHGLRARQRVHRDPCLPSVAARGLLHRGRGDHDVRRRPAALGQDAHRDAEYLAGVYPRHGDFVALRNALDPERRFGNDYLTQVLGA